MTWLDDMNPSAILFDLDGVLTPTAEVHRRAWSALFTPFFAERGVAGYTEADYYDHIDGKPRYDGVRDMLAARGITLAEGDPADGPDAETVSGLGNRKDAAFTEVLAREGIAPYPASARFLDAAVGRGLRVAVVSSSKNARAVLGAAGLLDRFAVVVDGRVAAAEHLPGKPAPDMFWFAARQLGVPVARAVVVEDALSGVRAGAAGGFAGVVGVDRGTGADRLRAAGADIVVTELDQLLGPDRPRETRGAR